MREETVDDLIAYASAIELAKALQEVLQTSPRTVEDSQFLSHLSAWIWYMEKHHAKG